ncbi:MAG: YicC/YloC family endoribonuclease [Bacteroidota bacterium]
MKSMTGYGKAVCSLPDKKITIEIKSVNSKQLDINLRLPSVYREKEADIRNMASKILERGKVDIFVAIESMAANNNFSINKELAQKYFNDLKQLAEAIQLPLPNDMLSVVMRMPDVMKTQSEELDDEEWKQIMPALEQALANTDSFRKNEGEVLRRDMLQRVTLIEKNIPKIEAMEKQRLATIRQRILTNITAFVEQEKIDMNRFEQELIYYIEKIDFTEEKVRLQKHCSYFIDIIKEDAAHGRKLGFITQEIGREINTLGSKANDAAIQKMVIEMKDELEKIKEQLLNVL